MYIKLYYKLDVICKFRAILETKRAKDSKTFYVIKGQGKTLIGRETAVKLGILVMRDAVNKIEHMELFLKNRNIIVDIPIIAYAKPVIQKYRRIPVSLEKQVKDRIRELCQSGIIEKVKGPARWISPLVVVPKNKGSDIRVYVDMRMANKAVPRENHPLPTMQEFLPHFKRTRFYSKIYIKNALKFRENHFYEEIHKAKK